MNQRGITLNALFAGCFVAAIFCVVSTIFYFLLFEKPWLRYTNIPFPVLAVAYQGQAIPIHVARCNDDRVPHVYTVARSLERVSKFNEPRNYMVLPDITISIQPGCAEGDSIVHVAPPNTPPGIWQLVGMSDVRGTLKNHLVEWRSVPFEVLEK